jgi:choice-of-anchor A domain-containing protein
MYQRALTQGQLMAALTGIDLPVNDPNNVRLNLGAGRTQGQRFVVNVRSSDLSHLRTLDIQNLRNDDTVIFNVRGGDSATWAWSVNAATYCGILWNFVDAKTIDVKDRQFNGTLFAPKASLKMRQNIEGNVLVSSMDIIGAPELHFGDRFQFKGDAPVPEPMTLLTLSAGVAALARRRRKS